jgi:hypothetical protein
MSMRLQLENLRRALKRASARLHDHLFEIACRVLLPISSQCKVCNILRGWLLGYCMGTAVTVFAFLCMGGWF